ncbi:unnamed protein product [Cuscuta europaea]|uniref:Uncharacterized protein n=1 Tax=Cuscuta europaea TaxID=41803 RepID=A0A9P0ZBW8_CUSEU|nr:unnamed protein product [Cuscuta europaea]
MDGDETDFSPATLPRDTTSALVDFFRIWWPEQFGEKGYAERGLCAKSAVSSLAGWEDRALGCRALLACGSRKENTQQEKNVHFGSEKNARKGALGHNKSEEKNHSLLLC